MSKCGGCGRFLSGPEAAKCYKCCAYYHRRCVSLPATGSIDPSWQCPECKRHKATDNKSETPVRGSSSAINTGNPCPSDMINNPNPTTSARISHSPISECNQSLTADITSELLVFRDNLRSINKDLQMFRDEMAEVRSLLKTCSTNLDRLDDRVSVLEKSRSQEGIENIITQLKAELNDRDQELLAGDVDIVNLPEMAAENVIETTLQVALKLGLNLERRDIVSAERVGPKHIVSTDASGPERRPRPIVVRLARHDLRDQLLSSARARRGMTSADLGMTGPVKRFYVNERLTRTNRQLFQKVRDVSKQNGWKFVWCKRGRILARQNPGTKPVWIHHENDIERISGQL